MANTTAYPITVDGVRLDTLAWNIEAAKITVPGVRAADDVAPGIHGVIPGLDEDYDEAAYALDMFVRGTDADGTIVADQVGQFRENLDALIHLFSKRYALLDLREVVDAGGTQRQALARRLDALVPTIELGQVGRFTITFTIPGAFWQDPATSDWTGTAGAASGTVQEVVPLRGATAPIQDAIYLVVGPATNPTVTDAATGRIVRLNQALAAGSQWRVNAGTWSSRTGTTLTLDSLDTDGTDAMADTDFSDQARLLTLNPALDTGFRRVKASLSGSAFSGTTQLLVRARRKFL